MLYRLQIAPGQRVARESRSGETLEALLKYLDAVKEKYFGILTPSEVRVTVNDQGRATLRFSNFPGGSFAAEIDLNHSAVLRSPAGHEIKVFVGGRDDAFFNDLTGFFRSINYAHSSIMSPTL